MKNYQITTPTKIQFLIFTMKGMRKKFKTFHLPFHEIYKNDISGCTCIEYLEIKNISMRSYFRNEAAHSFPPVFIS